MKTGGQSNSLAVAQVMHPTKRMVWENIFDCTGPHPAAQCKHFGEENRLEAIGLGRRIFGDPLHLPPGLNPVDAVMKAGLIAGSWDLAK